MTKEFNYTHIEFPATEKVAGNSVVIPASFFEALKRERPDGINWDRAELAVAVLKGEKDAVTPKPPEPEPTESQKFWRDMYRTGKLTPYQKERQWLGWSAAFEAWKNPQAHGTDSKVLAMDMVLRGGADKEYNQLGNIKRRATRAAVMVGNMVPNIAADILTSIPPNLFEKGFTEFLKKDLKEAQDKGKAEATDASKANKPEVPSPETKAIIDTLTRQVSGVRFAGRVGAVMNDKNITAIGNTIQRRLTGEKGWFTGEASDKLNDLLTAGYSDWAEDFINGPTLESAFRIWYQVPLIGALIEQGWTRWTNFQSTNEYSKGNLKALYTAIGLAIGILRDVDNKPNHTPSWKITNKIWDSWSWIRRVILGSNQTGPAKAA